MSKVLILPGDGIGQEIVAQALKVIDYLNKNHQLNMTLVHGLVRDIFPFCPWCNPLFL
jgi:3-isopropylmalate dehydrogenase